MNLLDYFGRVYVIHLPDRVDRYRALQRELARVGIDIKDPRVRIPPAPTPLSPNEMPSTAIYGNFLSHLNILKDAFKDNCRAAWVLEDDAIFRTRFLSDQRRLATSLDARKWDFCYLGHNQTRNLCIDATGLVPYDKTLIWAHCYAINRTALSGVIQYLERTLANPSGHPEGGKMYIDGAYSMFRQRNPDCVTLVANPLLSVQRGCRSSIAGRRWYDRGSLVSPIVAAARLCRDESWRRLGWPTTK
jgi:glycosyl transferase family 25